MRLVLGLLMSISLNALADTNSLESNCLNSLRQYYSFNQDLKVGAVVIGPKTEFYALLRFTVWHPNITGCFEGAVTNDRSCKVLSVADTGMCD